MVVNKYSETLENLEKALNMFEELLEADHPTIATLYHNIGDTYRCLEQYDKAVIYLEKALGLRTQQLSTAHVHIAESYESLGWTYCYLLNFEKALDFCEKALKIGPDRAAVYHCVGIIHYLQCNHECALSALRKAVDLYEKFPAKRNNTLVRVHKTIAQILTVQEEPNDAIKHYNKAIEIYHDENVSDSIVFQEIYNARAAFFRRSGRYDEAFSDLEMALHVAKNVKENLLLPSILIEMGNVHLEKHHFDEALKYFQEAEEKETVLSIARYPTKGERLSLLADLLYQQKNYDTALNHYKSALEIFSQSSPPDTLSIAHIQVKLGLTYEKKSLYDDSLSAFDEALRLFKMMFKSTHPTIASLHYRTARIQKIQGTCHIAFEAFKTALYHQLHSTSINYLELADTYDNLADIAAEQKEIEESSRYCQESLQIRLIHNPCDVFFSYVNMGRLKSNQKQYLEAQKFFQRAIDVFVPDNTFDSSYSLGRIYVDLALVYNVLQKYDEAMKTISKANEANRLEDQKIDSLIAYATAYIYQMQKKYEEGLNQYEKILSEPHLVVDDETMALTYIRMASIYYEQKLFKLAIEYCEKCLNYRCKSVTLDAVYESMARIYVSLGEEAESAKFEYYKKALDNFMKMLALCLFDDKKLSEIHSSIANLHLQLDDIDLSIKHYELSRDHLLNMSPRNYNELIAVYKALAHAYTCRQDTQKIIENCELILNIYLNNDCSQSTKDFKKAAIVCNHISVLYYESNNIEKAIVYMEQELQLELSATVSTPELDVDDQIMLSLASVYLNLGTLYGEYGEIGKQIKNLKMSLDIYSKLISSSNPPDILIPMAEICVNLGDCYEKISDSYLAFNYYQAAFNFFDKSGTISEMKLIEYKQCLEKTQKSRIQKED